MTKPTTGQIGRLRALGKLTELALEARLVKLRRAAELRDATCAALAVLNTPRPAPEGDLPLSALARSNLLYDLWADRQRREMNLKLARETALWLEERADASTAFGRNDVLNRLAHDLKARLAKLPPKP